MLPYRNLDVWRRSYALGMRIIELLEAGELSRRFWLRDQLCRAAMSIQANIAEGNGRSTPLDYAAFLDRARASAFETDTWLLAAADRGLIGREEQLRLEAELDGLSAMLFTMTRTLRHKASLPSRESR